MRGGITALLLSLIFIGSIVCRHREIERLATLAGQGEGQDLAGHLSQVARATHRLPLAFHDQLDALLFGNQDLVDLGIDDRFLQPVGRRVGRLTDAVDPSFRLEAIARRPGAIDQDDMRRRRERDADAARKLLAQGLAIDHEHLMVMDECEQSGMAIPECFGTRHALHAAHHVPLVCLDEGIRITADGDCIEHAIGVSVALFLLLLNEIGRRANHDEIGAIARALIYRHWGILLACHLDTS